MDRAHPLTEAKWVRTGNPDDWILSVIGNGGENTSLSSSSGARAAQQLPKGEQGNEPSSSASKSAPNVTGSAWKGKIRVVDPDAVRLLLSAFSHTCPFYTYAYLFFYLLLTLFTLDSISPHSIGLLRLLVHHIICNFSFSTSFDFSCHHHPRVLVQRNLSHLIPSGPHFSPILTHHTPFSSLCHSLTVVATYLPACTRELALSRQLTRRL